MRKYYTRPCNFYYGNYAKKLIKEKKALPLTGGSYIAFDKIEIFERRKKRTTKSEIFNFKDIKKLNKEKKITIKKDLEKIVSKRKSIYNIKFDKPQIVGVLNITPDSFSDGGLFLNNQKAYRQICLLIKDGASIIDIGGESTRPGSKTVNKNDEWKRVKKTIVKTKKFFKKIPLSLDTRKSYVMKKGIEYGIDIINDVSGLKFDSESFNVIKSKQVPFILHHMQGTPNTMQNNPKYSDALLDIYDFFEEKINLA